MDCVFCKIVRGELPCRKIYEDEDTLAFLDAAADIDGHTLVIPKKHLKNILDCDRETLEHLMNTVQKVSKFYVESCGYSGVNLLNASGETAGQSVPHFHIHLIPRKADDGIDAWPHFTGSRRPAEEMHALLRLPKGFLFATERLLVRRFTPEDAADLYPILSDPEVMRYIEPPFTFPQTEGFIRTAGLCRPPLIYAVELRESEQLIGQFIFHTVDCPEEYEIGWILSREHWHHGYADELTAALIRYAREQCIHSLLLECDPHQTASSHLAEKYGFRYDGMEDGCAVYRLQLHK